MRTRSLIAVSAAMALASCADMLSPLTEALGCYRMDYTPLGVDWPPITNLVHLRSDSALKAYFPGRMVSPNPDPAGRTPLGSWSMPNDKTLLLGFVGFEETVQIRVTRVTKNSDVPSHGEPDFVGTATFQTDVTQATVRPATLTRESCRD